MPEVKQNGFVEKPFFSTSFSENDLQCFNEAKQADGWSDKRELSHRYVTKELFVSQPILIY